MTLQSVRCGISSLGYLALVACFVGVVNSCWEEHRGSYCLGLSGDNKSGSDSLEACQSRCNSSACAAITYFADPQACYIAATRCDLNKSSAGGKVLVNHCQEVTCPDHIMVSNLETSWRPHLEDGLFGVYSRVDGACCNKRPVYERSIFHLFYVDRTWDYNGEVGGTWTIAYTRGSWWSFDLDDVKVTSRIQFATCPHYATHFYEAKVIGWAPSRVRRVPRNISMQETALPAPAPVEVAAIEETVLPTPAPKPFVEIAAEWLDDYFGLVLGFSIVFLLSPLLVLLFGFVAADIEQADRMVKTKVEDTLEGFKQLLQSPEEAETMRQKQELLRRLHYYKQKDEESLFAWKVVSICVNVYMWVCLAYIVFENVSGLRDELDEPEYYGPGSIHGIVVGAFCLSYVIVLFESFCMSPEKKFLQDVREVQPVQQARTVIDKMKGLPPQLRMQACKFHLETQPVTLHQTDVWGNSNLTTTAFHGRRVTDTVEDFIPLSWVDLSNDVLEPSQRGVTTLFVESIICAQDTETSRRIESRYNRFKQDQLGPDRSDAYVECQLDYQLPGVQKRLLICDNRPPWWMNTKVFYLASILGLTWIYRLCLKMMTSSSTLVLVKQVVVGDTSEA